MTDSTFSLSKLWPDFSLLISGDYTSPHWLSALIVAILFGIALLFFLYSFWKADSARRHINFYKDLLKDLSPDSLIERRRDLIKKANSKPKYGKLWVEFDESLVPSSDGRKLYNTIDASHFFNTRTLGHGLIENRMLAAVPGFLTAIGVLGTFAGLQMGLGSLELSKNAGVEILRTGIGNMISGASIAFLTSVWGVFTSLVFNFIEKFLERRVRIKIFNLQNLIDNLYPRITAEEALIKIEDHSKQSQELLGGLAEKIGDKMQETLHQVTESIQTSMQRSIEDVLSPALAALADNAKNSSEKALKALVDDFMDGVKQAGAEQKQGMQDAANQLSASVNSMNQVIDSFSNQLAQQQKSADSKFEDVLHRFSGMMESLHTNTEKQQNALMSSMQQQLENTVDSLNSIAQNISTSASDTIEKVGAATQERLEEMKAMDIKLRDNIREVMELQKTINQDLLSELGHLSQQFHEVSRASTAIAENVSKGAEKMQNVSGSLTVVSANMKNTAETLGNNIASAVDQTKELINTTSSLASALHHDIKQMGEIGDKLISTVNTLEKAAQYADKGFGALGDHQKQLMQSLRMHVDDLEEKISDLLKEYAQMVKGQTQERLNEWNRQTNEFTSSMVDAVQTIASVVDEIEAKTGSR